MQLTPSYVKCWEINCPCTSISWNIYFIYQKLRWNILKIYLYAGDCAISFLSDLILSEVNWGYCAFIWHLCRDPFCLKFKRRLKGSIGSDVYDNFRAPFPLLSYSLPLIMLDVISRMTKTMFIYKFKKYSNDLIQ